MEPRSWLPGAAADLPRVAGVLAYYGFQHESTVRNVSGDAIHQRLGLVTTDIENKSRGPDIEEPQDQRRRGPEAEISS